MPGPNFKFLVPIEGSKRARRREIRLAEKLGLPQLIR
jgi:hypothetical protein